MQILRYIESPADLRVLSYGELRHLAQEIRERLVEVTSKTGGHLASSLGAVELILVLHRIFDFSQDRLVFDVGHQAYAHKLITNRDELFDTLRTFEGICGFTRRDESVYDVHESGHASDSLSIACGLAAARDLRGSDEDIVAFIGDAALFGGMAFEALNQIGQEQRNITILLNDNGMSISRNVGAMSRYLSKVRSSSSYTRTRNTLGGGLSRMGGLGRVLMGVGDYARSTTKKLFIPGMLFEDMGIKYLGPIDGHAIPLLDEVITRARAMPEPVLIHTVTKKGKGYAPAEQSPDIYHGVGPFNPATGELISKPVVGKSFTSIFSDALIAEAEKNPDIVAITAAMEDGTGLAAFKERYADRFFDVGIAEEHAVALAAGFALGGKLPIVAIYSTFLQRAYDQIVINVALPKQHIVFCLDRAGLVGEDGPTHHGALDLAYLRSIPHMRILAPADEDDFCDAFYTALAMNDGPVALRYPRGSAPASTSKEAAQLLPYAKAKLLREGSDLAILAVGRFVAPAIETATLLSQAGIEAQVYNMLWVKPIDEEAVLKACASKLIVTLEDGTTIGGFGDAVLETIATHQMAHPPVLTLGLPDDFVSHGSVESLFEKLGLTPEQLTQTILSHIR